MGTERICQTSHEWSLDRHMCPMARLPQVNVAAYDSALCGLSSKGMYAVVQKPWRLVIIHICRTGSELGCADRRLAGLASFRTHQRTGPTSPSRPRSPDTNMKKSHRQPSCSDLNTAQEFYLIRPANCYALGSFAAHARLTRPPPALHGC